ncbi:MAG TPA: copper-binding protein [Bryobacteraceae bacterium]|jgi:Cu/Ag efflux protein CusF
MINPKPTVLLLTVLLGACARSADNSAPPLNRYSIHGEVMRLEPDQKLATIRHQKIVGYMDAMTMTFPIKDPQEFSALQIGNCIEGTVFVQGDNLWVGEIKHLDTSPDMCVAPPAPEPQKTP